MKCQRKTAEIIIAEKGNYLLDAKGNQRNLKEEITEYTQAEYLRKDMDRERKTEKKRDRI